jgi:hypothetical protein
LNVCVTSYTLLKAYSAKNLKSPSSEHNETGEVERQIQIRKSDSYVIESITLIYKLRAMTVRCENGSYMLRAITN